MALKLKASKKLSLVRSKTKRVNPDLDARALGAEEVSTAKEFWATHWVLLRKIPK